MKFKSNHIQILSIFFLLGCGETTQDIEPSTALTYGKRVIDQKLIVLNLERNLTSYNEETNRHLDYNRNELPILLSQYESERKRIDSKNKLERMRVDSLNSENKNNYNIAIEAENKRVKELNDPILYAHKQRKKEAEQKLLHMRKEDQKEVDKAKAIIQDIAINGTHTAASLASLLNMAIEPLDNPSVQDLERMIHVHGRYTLANDMFPTSQNQIDMYTEHNLYVPRIHSDEDYSEVYRKISEKPLLHIEKYPPRPVNVSMSLLPMPSKPINPFKDYTKESDILAEQLLKEEEALDFVISAARNKGLQVNWDKAASYVERNIDYYQKVKITPSLKEEFFLNAMNSNKKKKYRQTFTTEELCDLNMPNNLREAEFSKITLESGVIYDVSKGMGMVAYVCNVNNQRLTYSMAQDVRSSGGMYKWNQGITLINENTLDANNYALSLLPSN